MGLKNYQYNRILREYDKRRLENKHKADQKYERLCGEIPELDRLDRQMTANSARLAKCAVRGENGTVNALKQANEELKAEKLRLLKEHGYPSGYLEPICHCPDCRDTGYRGREKCHCFKQAIVDLLYTQSNLKAAIARENFKHFRYDYYSDEYKEPLTGLTPLENIRRVTACCRNFIERFDTDYANLLFYGNTGVGKTFLTNCIAGELLNTAHTVIYLTSFELFDILEKNKFSKSEEDYESAEQFHGILECDLLIIDDLGTELNNTFISSQLYLCINERHLNQRATIISTNLSLDDLNRQYSERIFSRITSNYLLLKIFGEDIRLKKVLN